MADSLRLDLSNIKVVFIDFDDSLCIHLNHATWLDWFSNCVFGNGDIYLTDGKCAPMPGMAEFIKDCIEANTTRICLTWAFADFVSEPKKKFINYHYGDNAIDKLYCIGTREYKVEFIREYCLNLGLKPWNVLIVEDHPETEEEAILEGYTIVTPQEISVRYLNNTQ